MTVFAGGSGEIGLKSLVSSCFSVLGVGVVLPTFRRKLGIGFARGSTVEVGSKFSGRFEVRGIRKNYFYGFIYIYTHFLCLAAWRE